MRPVRLLLSALLMLPATAFPGLGRAQEPQTPSPPGVRLVYDLPAYELSKVMATKPGASLEVVVEDAISSIRKRLGEHGKVMPRGTTGFTVEASADADELRRLRQRIENIGKLELRVVAAADYETSKGVKPFDLAKEKQRLQDWLDHGGRELLQQDHHAIDKFGKGGPQGPLAAGKLGWFVHVIEPEPGDPQRWQLAFSQLPGDMAAATVMVGDAALYNGGRIPAEVLAMPRPQQQLVELVAINLDEVHFGSTDLDPDMVRVGAGPGGAPVVNYGVRGALASKYADWSEKYIRHHVAILVNDRVLSVPMFVSRVPGSGQISGSFDQAQAEALAQALQSAPLPVAPVLMRQEPAAPGAPSATGR